MVGPVGKAPTPPEPNPPPPRCGLPGLVGSVRKEIGNRTKKGGPPHFGGGFREHMKSACGPFGGQHGSGSHSRIQTNLELQDIGDTELAFETSTRRNRIHKSCSLTGVARVAASSFPEPSGPWRDLRRLCDAAAGGRLDWMTEPPQISTDRRSISRSADPQRYDHV